MTDCHLTKVGLPKSHFCLPSSQEEEEAEGSGFQSQPQLHSEFKVTMNARNGRITLCFPFLFFEFKATLSYI